VAEVVNINDLLAGHVTLEVECLDRVYLNAYVGLSTGIGPSALACFGPSVVIGGCRS
jgi:hypothetical protein